MNKAYILERIKSIWKKYDTYIIVGIFIVLIWLRFRSANEPEQEPTVTEKSIQMTDDFFKNIDESKQIELLKDSLTKLTHENITLQEELALRASDNLELRARIWAINEYIRTGRFPADSTVRRQFPSHHGQSNKVRVR